MADAPKPKGEIDERFIKEWLAYGYAEMDAYLAKHAAFDDYCNRREEVTDGTERPGQPEAVPGDLPAEPA